MSQADRIREFVLHAYIQPARNVGLSEVTIRAGDIHQDMNLTNALPAVCSALGSAKFEVLATVRRLAIIGPSSGSNVFFHFELLNRLSTVQLPSIPDANSSCPHGPSLPPRTFDRLDWSRAVVLVSCVGSKLSHPAPACELYVSDWFRKARSLVEQEGARWFILSAFYGLVSPDKEIDPYEYTLNNLGIKDRREWAEGVLTSLFPCLQGSNRVVFLAGARYRECLIEPLKQAGFDVEVPMDGLRIGEQLAWLSAQFKTG